MSDELELLDQLLTGSMPYLEMERHVFAGDRMRLLNSIKRMAIESQITVTVNDTPIAIWRIEAWSRRPHDRDTESDLQHARLAITEIGAKMLY